jgi:primosomal protein N' (replication factor Y)
MKIVTILPLEKVAFKENLTYFSAEDLENGNIVKVPFRNRKILGLVIHKEDAVNIKSDIKGMSFKLKKIIEVKKNSIFKNEFIESTQLLSDYFISKKDTSAASLIPSIFREKYDEIAKFENININIKNDVKNIKNEKLIFQASLEDRISYYKTLIRGQFALKKSIFIVVPTEYDIDLFSQSLSKGIENFTFSFSSKLKPKQILEKYKQIMNCTHGVLILGTAQFLSINLSEIGYIIVEHESSPLYKMFTKPHFDLRIFAEIYSAKINSKFMLSDTILRYETIARKETGMLNEVYPLSFRTNLNGLEIEILNRDTDKQKFTIMSEKSMQEIEHALSKNKKVFIFSLRKGLATYTVCRNCNETVSCEKCLAPVVLYLSADQKKRMFICNKCGTEKSPETTCENCGSWDLVPLGIGIDGVFAEVKENFPHAKIFKIDKESTKNATEAKKIINDFEKSEAGILIGTEMAFFYLQDKADLSIISSFDSLWSIPNFKMSEKIIQILLSIISKTNKKIIIQTKNKNDPALVSIKSGNLLPFIREEIEDRKNLDYPPFKRFIKITYLSDKSELLDTKNKLKNIFKEFNPDIFSGFISKKNNQYVTNALIKIDPKQWSLPEILIGSTINKRLSDLLTSLPPSYEVTVDPEDLL